MKKVLGVLFAFILVLSSTSIAETASFSLPLGIEFGMTEKQMNIHIRRYEDTTSNNAFLIENVLEDNDRISARAIFNYPVSSMKISFFVDGEYSTKEERSQEYKAVEELLNKKYGETDFIMKRSENIRHNLTTKTASGVDFTSFFGAGEELTQRIVPYAKGGYVLVSHYVYMVRDGSLLWVHGIEYEYIGDVYEFEDNKFLDEKIQLDDVL